MSEEEKKEEPEKEPEKAPPKSTPMIDAANEAAKRLEKANKKNEELIAKQEAMAIDKTLGGEAEAGAPAEEETDADYAKKVMANDAGAK